jgi:dTDP-D-glucose 4,6-dehydratase
MKEINKTSNFIGSYFRQYIKQVRFDRKVLVRRLGFTYADNEKAVCDYLNKKDYLWWEYEVEDWCCALSIPTTASVYSKLIEKAGKRVE